MVLVHPQIPQSVKITPFEFFAAWAEILVLATILLACKVHRQICSEVSRNQHNKRWNFYAKPAVKSHNQAMRGHLFCILVTIESANLLSVHFLNIY